MPNFSLLLPGRPRGRAAEGPKDTEGLAGHSLEGDAQVVFAGKAGALRHRLPRKVCFPKKLPARSFCTRMQEMPMGGESGFGKKHMRKTQERMDTASAMPTIGTCSLG